MRNIAGSAALNVDFVIFKGRKKDDKEPLNITRRNIAKARKEIEHGSL